MKKKEIKVRFNLDEYKDIQQKTKKYGYTAMSAYIKDIALDEVIIKEDIQNKNEICEVYEELRKEMVKQEKVIDDLVISVSDSIETREKFENLISQLIYQRKSIERLLNKKLFRDFVIEKEGIIQNKKEGKL